MYGPWAKVGKSPYSIICTRPVEDIEADALNAMPAVDTVDPEVRDAYLPSVSLVSPFPLSFSRIFYVLSFLSTLALPFPAPTSETCPPSLSPL